MRKRKFKFKALSPIVATILLVVVSVILVSIVLNWGRNITNSSLNETDPILKQTNQNYLIGSPKLNAQGILTFKNITPGEKSITITGYQIVSSSEDDNFNNTIALNETTIQPGATHVISIQAFPPEPKFTILLITDENEYISIEGIRNPPVTLQDIPVEEVLELPYVMDGENKLYIHPTDNSTGVAWGCPGTLIGSGAQSLTNGLANTTAILAGCVTRPIAASICNDLDFGGYDDWYLPARDQLGEICSYQAVIYTGDYSSSWIGLDFCSYSYWTSTEWGANDAYYMEPGGWSLEQSSKSEIYRVRCVRGG